MRDWALGSADDSWVSMAVPADGSYGIEEAYLFFSCDVQERQVRNCQGLEIDDFSRERMDATRAELQEERDGVAHLL